MATLNITITVATGIFAMVSKNVFTLARVQAAASVIGQEILYSFSLAVVIRVKVSIKFFRVVFNISDGVKTFFVVFDLQVSSASKNPVIKVMVTNRYLVDLVIKNLRSFAPLILVMGRNIFISFAISFVSLTCFGRFIVPSC